MMRSTKIWFPSLLAALVGCSNPNDAAGPDAHTSEIVSDLTVADCAGMTAAFSQTFADKSTCPKPTGTDEDDKTQCEAVKKVALNNYKTKLGKDPNCSDGWIFGPDTLLTKCINDSGKNLCKLTATDPPSGKEGWPKTNNYSQCLNDWVVYCVKKYPLTMGVGAGAPVCFHSDIDWTKLGASSVTAREACQLLKGAKGSETLPDKCDADLCKPAPKKPATKKGKTTCASPTPSADGYSLAATSCVETWECIECDPASDPDCAYDVACGCKTCEPGDTNPECSPDLACPIVEPTPVATVEPTPVATVDPTPTPTASATPLPTASPIF